MVENQHRKITGYRDLSEAEIALMNEIKDHEERLASLLGRLYAGVIPGQHPDLRALSLARTNLQQGFMWFVRAIAKPSDAWDGSLTRSPSVVGSAAPS